MKRIGTALFVIFILIILVYLFNRFSLAKHHPYYELPTNKDDASLTIGIIGDSWVSGNMLDSFLSDHLQKHNLDANILSSGHPGAKTKLIYQNLYKESHEEYSSRFVIAQQPEYGLVVGGVNDAIAQLGKKNYSFHMVQIIKHLLYYDIIPVVVPLPEFSVTKAIHDMEFYKRYRNILTAYFTNKGELDNVQQYRNELSRTLEEHQLLDRVIFVDLDKVCNLLVCYNLINGLFLIT
ncbi:MAG: SGNH/GDSL hydrolase family protein [Bacteroidota bacterium]